MLVISSLVAPLASADDVPLRPRLAPSLTPERRLEVLDAQLDLAHREASIWYFSWASGWTALAIGQAVQYPSDSRQLPAYWIWTSVSVASTALTWLFRPDVLVTRPAVTQLRADASLSIEERLRQTEALWVRAHDDENLQRAWWQQLICVVSNLTPFLIQGLGYREWNWLFLTFGLVTSELQAFSFPQLLHRFGVELPQF